jgi:ATP-dependent RNA helicase DDX56/DBP9
MGISTVILVPTRELAQQVSQVVTGLSAYCAKVIRSINLTQKVSDAVQRSQLAESPDIIITTPARIAQNLNRPEVDLGALTHLIIDEADLVLSYGYEEDLQSLAKVIPQGVQMMLLSATLSADIETLKGLFCRDPVILELDEPDNKTGGLSQYVVK